MSCFTFYVFNRQGVCQYYHEWVKATKPAGDENGISEDFKLMFGLCWSLKAFAGAIDPKSGRKRSMGTPARIGDGCGFRSFKTESYKLHFLESPSGMKLVMCTAPTVGSLTEPLQYIYSTLFLEHVAKNPLYTIGEAFLFEPFTLALNKYMVSLGLLS